jgi:polyisoprenoid-binding protein YceI
MNQRLALSAILTPTIAILVLLCGPARAEVIRFPIDTQKSQLTAVVAEPLTRMRDVPYAEGSLHIVSGEVSGDPADLAATGHVSLVIDMTTYASGSDRRDRTIISSSLETRLYPTATFTSTRIDQVDVVVPGAVGSATVVGNLTLHGTTRQVSVPVHLSLSPENEFTGDGEVTFRYTDFGVAVPKLAYVFSAGDEVTVKFRIVAGNTRATATPSSGTQ